MQIYIAIYKVFLLRLLVIVIFNVRIANEEQQKIIWLRVDWVKQRANNHLIVTTIFGKVDFRVKVKENFNLVYSYVIDYYLMNKVEGSGMVVFWRNVLIV